jgi:DNA-binding response OmpR family regulator
VSSEQEDRATTSAERTVLVVDDDTAIRRLVRTVLEADGYDVLEADSGERALQLANEAGPAVVLLDVMMPGLSGIEVCRRLDHDAVKVVMLTGRDERDMEDACRQAGADALVTKPFSSIDLLDTVASLVPA